MTMLCTFIIRGHCCITGLALPGKKKAGLATVQLILQYGSHTHAISWCSWKKM